ncbi:MAG: FkbM family methyltransferase [Nitrososphaerota archaeon]|jgi:FkbM family methyltransferase|nr:FkbM family methyltransferase [Nitrososphaerota archaeon]
MVTIKGLFQTLAIVKNPSTIWSLKTNKKPSKVTFPNGIVFQVTWPEFRSLRDSYEFIKKCQIQQINDTTFKITTNNYQLIGSHLLLCILAEMESGAYDYDYQNKIVLDIGGFQGESAAYFWSKGAKKIVIYEPVLEHHQYINKNIQLNKINAEVHPEGIGDKDGEKIVTYERTDWGFGLETQEAQNSMNIKIKDITKVIAESNADIAKIDCEGAEISLINVPTEILRKIEFMMIEIHTPQTRNKLIEKFKNAGFTITKDSGENINSTISMIHFKKIPDPQSTTL